MVHYGTVPDVPDESVGRQDLPLDETVANKITVRLLLPSIGAKYGWFFKIHGN